METDSNAYFTTNWAPIRHVIWIHFHFHNFAYFRSHKIGKNITVNEFSNVRGIFKLSPKHIPLVVHRISRDEPMTHAGLSLLYWPGCHSLRNWPLILVLNQWKTWRQLETTFSSLFESASYYEISTLNDTHVKSFIHHVEKNLEWITRGLFFIQNLNPSINLSNCIRMKEKIF